MRPASDLGWSGELPPSDAPRSAEALSPTDRGHTDTKDRLLDAAERLFAERGFDGTSLRAVTQAAGASVSAANYHFGSKRELLAATLRRRVEPVNARRLERLGALLGRPGGPAPSVEEVIEAFVRPLFELRAEAAAEGKGDPQLFRQVAARLYADPVVRSLRTELFKDVNERFQAALNLALPATPAERVPLLQGLVVSSIVHLVNDPDADLAPDVLLESLVRYAAGGLRAVAAGGGGEEQS